MCEELPGPRCSPDVKTKLIKLNKEINESQPHADAAREWYKAAVEAPNFNYEGVEAMVYHQRMAAFNTLVIERRKANTEYDATPEGQRSLESMIQVSSNATVSTTFQHVRNGRLVEGSDSLTVQVPRQPLLKNRLEVAKEHRNWQKSVGASLKKCKQQSPEKALFMAEGISDSIQERILATRRVLGSISRTQNEISDDLLTNKVNRDEALEILKLSSIEAHEHSTRLNCLMIRQEDMEGFIKNLN